MKKSAKRVLATIGVIALAGHYVWYTNDIQERRQTYYPEPKQVATATLEVVSTDIIVTNYYLGDGSSGTTTASGKQIKDFEVNDSGMYTYNGMIVVATANPNRLNKELKDGYIGQSLYSVLDIEIDGVSYEAIVLDVCGSCYGVEGENKQRYDVFTVGNVIGKVEGKIYGTSIQN